MKKAILFFSVTSLVLCKGGGRIKTSWVVGWLFCLSVVQRVMWLQQLIFLQFSSRERILDKLFQNIFKSVKQLRRNFLLFLLFSLFLSCSINSKLICIFRWNGFLFFFCYVGKVQNKMLLKIGDHHENYSSDISDASSQWSF